MWKSRNYELNLRFVKRKMKIRKTILTNTNNDCNKVRENIKHFFFHRIRVFLSFFYVGSNTDLLTNLLSLKPHWKQAQRAEKGVFLPLERYEELQKQCLGRAAQVEELEELMSLKEKEIDTLQQSFSEKCQQVEKITNTLDNTQVGKSLFMKFNGYSVTIYIVSLYISTIFKLLFFC